MAEEWGSIVIKAPADVRKAFVEHKDDLLIAIKRLVEFSGCDISGVDEKLLHADSITNKAGFIKLDYDCSNWVDFSAALLGSANNISYYARHSDEYGTCYFFSLGPRGKRISVSRDLEEDEEDERVPVELGRWVGSLPVALTRAFPDFNALKENEYIKPGSNRKKAKRQPQINLYCYFSEPVSEDDVRQRVSPEFREFESRQKSNDGLASLFLSAVSEAKKKTEKPDLQILEWFPICDDRSKTAADLLNELKDVTVGPIYAYNFFGESSYPYKILRCASDRVEEIFDSDDYAEADLQLLSEAIDREVSRRVNWFVADFGFVEHIHETVGLRKYADDNIVRLKQEVDNALIDQQKAHEKIWAKHADQAVPLLANVGLYYYFQSFDADQVEASASRLQQKGMRKLGVERGLGYSGSNSICAPEQQREAAEWLNSNVEELAGHRVVFDSDLLGDVIIVNMY